MIQPPFHMVQQKNQIFNTAFLHKKWKKILPDIVETNAGGAKLINYLALIPILVQSVQELQGIIEEQTITIEQLSSGQLYQQSPLKQENQILSCITNSVTGIALISTQLKDDIFSAKLIITSITGEHKSESQLSYTNPNLSVDISSWRHGIYMISLYVNDNLVDFSRLVKE